MRGDHLSPSWSSGLGDFDVRRYGSQQTSTGPTNGPWPAAFLAATLKVPHPKPGTSKNTESHVGGATNAVNQVSVS